jgi:hypothetical protein
VWRDHGWFCFDAKEIRFKEDPALVEGNGVTGKIARSDYQPYGGSFLHPIPNPRSKPYPTRPGNGQKIAVPYPRRLSDTRKGLAKVLINLLQRRHLPAFGAIGQGPVAFDHIGQ